MNFTIILLLAGIFAGYILGLISSYLERKKKERLREKAAQIIEGIREDKERLFKELREKFPEHPVAIKIAENIAEAVLSVVEVRTRRD